MARINDVKHLILSWMTATGQNPEYTKIWAEAYATLVQAETQEKMTEFATGHCAECGEHLEEDDFPEDVG